MLIFRECAVDTISQHALWFPFRQVGIQSTRRRAGQTKDEKTDTFSLSSFRQEQRDNAVNLEIL